MEEAGVPGENQYTAAIFLLFFLDAFYSFAKIKQMIHVDLNEGTTFLSAAHIRKCSVT
jgi:hypothetical protein